MSTLLAAHCAVTRAAGVLWLGDRGGASPRALARLARAWLVLAALALVLGLRAPRSTWEPVPGAQWAATRADQASAVLGRATAPLADAARRSAIPTSVVWLLPLLGAVRAGVGLVRLRRSIAGVALHRLGRVEVRVCPDLGGPAALAPPGRALILVDPATCASPADLAVAVHHEATHLRHGDAAWAWAWCAVEAVLFPNPLAFWFVRRLHALEELACDEAAVRVFPPRAYAETLLRVAVRASPLPGAAPAAATGDLHRRIAMLISPRPHRRISVFLVPLGLLTLAVAAFAGRAQLPLDPWMPSAEAAAPAPSGSTEAALARILGSADASSFYRTGLANRPAWAPLVDGALRDAGLPAWLAAVPLVESGYTNLGATDDPRWPEARLSRAPGMPGRGLWMFIPATARTYGLRVDDTRDERFDPVLETAAAVALLTDLHAELGTWELALAAYNQGPKVVHAAIAAEGTRDLEALVRAGALNGYVPEVLAAARLIEQPQLLD